MILPFDSTKLHPHDPNKYNNWERFEDKLKEVVFIGHSMFDDREVVKKANGKKIIYIEFDEPNRFFMTQREFVPNNHDAFRKSYYKILTLCPYTAKWLNFKHRDNRSIPIFQPFNKELLPGKVKKKYDVIYWGQVVSPEITSTVKMMSKFNYRFVSSSESDLVTDKSISYLDKLTCISETKISIIHNMLFPKYSHIESVWQTPDYEKNEAFKMVPGKLPGFIPTFLKRKFVSKKKVVMPQVKQRLFEAAFCRSLILCRKDPFNIIEYFFTPGVDFVYYEGDRLEEKITEILSNFAEYEPLIDNAFKKVVAEYTTERFVEKYLIN